MPNRTPSSNPAEFAINAIFKSIAKVYGACMWVLGLQDETKSLDQRARVAVFRALIAGGLLLLLVGGGAGYYLYRKTDRERRAITDASNAALVEKLGTKVVTLDASASSVVFDPASRPFRVVLIEKDQVKVAMIEVLNLKDRKVVEVKQLATGAVLLAQYLPANKQMEVGVLNGLEQVQYLGGWQFDKSEKEVRILIHEALPEIKIPSLPPRADVAPPSELAPKMVAAGSASPTPPPTSPPVSTPETKDESKHEDVTGSFNKAS